MCRAIQIMQEGKKKAEAENRQLRAENRQIKAEYKAENRQIKAELKERTREKKLLIKMLKESGRSEAEIDSYIKSAFLASA